MGGEEEEEKKSPRPSTGRRCGEEDEFTTEARRTLRRIFDQMREYEFTVILYRAAEVGR